MFINCSNNIGCVCKSSLTNLEVLYLDSNQVSGISPLANLTGLTDLDLEGKQMGGWHMYSFSPNDSVRHHDPANAGSSGSGA